MAKVKKIPLRRCQATGENFPKATMFRIVRTPEGEVKLDPSGKMNGRGAYISKTLAAIELAEKKKVLDKQLEIEIPATLYRQLRATLGE